MGRRVGEEQAAQANGNTQENERLGRPMEMGWKARCEICRGSTRVDLERPAVVASTVRRRPEGFVDRWRPSSEVECRVDSTSLVRASFARFR